MGIGVGAVGVAIIFENFGIKFLSAIGDTKTARWWDRYYNKGCTTGSTVGKLIKAMDSGTYIVHFKGHVFCVKDKNIIDKHPVNSNKYCTAIWKYEVN